MKRFAIYCIILFLAVSSLGPKANADSTPAYVTEITVRTVENFKNHSDVVKFINSAAKNNVSIINLNVKEDEDDSVPSGYVFYKSSIAPIAEGYLKFDALKDVIEEAHKKSIQVRAWIPQFHDKAAIERQPDWQMKAVVDGKVVPYESNGEYFVNPLNADAQAYEESLIKEVVSNYDIDGLILDWLRFDDYNMDMSDGTRQAFIKKNGYDPITIDFSAENGKRTQWNKWRTAQIGQYVSRVKKDVEAIVPGLFLGVYILPPEFEECGQDLKQFSQYIDFVSPMAYYKDWDFSPDWVYGADSGIIADTKAKADGIEIIPVLDIPSNKLYSEYHQIYINLKKNYPEITNISYFAYGKWTTDMFKILQVY